MDLKLKNSYERAIKDIEIYQKLEKKALIFFLISFFCMIFYHGMILDYFFAFASGMWFSISLLHRNRKQKAKRWLKANT